MLKLVYQFPVLTARLARATGLVVALAASTASAQMFVDDIERQALRSQSAAQRVQQQAPAPSQQSRFPQPTVAGGIQGQRPQQPEKQGWSFTKSIGGLFGGKSEQQPERSINMPPTTGTMARQGSAQRPTLFGSTSGEQQQQLQQLPQQPQARPQKAISRSGSAAKYAQQQSRQGGIEAAGSRPANKPSGLLAFWSNDDTEPSKQQPPTQPRQGNIAQVTGQQPLAAAPKWDAAPLRNPAMPLGTPSDAGMVAMVTDREENQVATRTPSRGDKLPALPSSDAVYASDMPSSPAVFASDMPQVTAPSTSTDMPGRALPRPMSAANTPSLQNPMQNPMAASQTGPNQVSNNPQFQAGAAAMAQQGAPMRPAASQPNAGAAQEITNPHAAGVVDRRMDSTPVTQPRPMTVAQPKPLQVAVAPTAKPQVAASAQPKFTSPAQPANPVAPPESEDAQPSPRAAELLTEANRLSSEAQNEEELTAVVQLCRHVLAIDNSKVAIDYSNNLASWALNRRGEIRTDEGRIEEALLDFNDALRLDPNRYRAIHNRGVLAAQAGRFADAFDDFNRTIELSPDYPKAYSNRAALWVQAGEMEKASSDYRQAIALDPDLAVAHKGRGRVCHMMGQFDLALQHLDAAARLSEGDARIICLRGDLLLDMGRYRNALADYQQAVQLDNSLAVAHRSMAWLLATCPDRDIRSGEAALASANRAMALCTEPSDLEYDTLAAAQAAAGDFTSAQATMDKCLELSKEKDQPNYRWRKELYQKGQAYITEPASDIQQASYAE